MMFTEAGRKRILEELEKPMYYTCTTTSGTTTFNPIVQIAREEDTPMRALYEVYLVNRLTLEVKKSLHVADSAADACTAAIITAGIPVSELKDWAKEAVDIMGVPEVAKE